ncbi:MAG: ribbon-helix-helix domain-containing protein [Candidatus Pacearchaeota archaeon]
MEVENLYKMRKNEINRILKKYREVFETLEQYDQTGELPFQRKRIDTTLSVEAINKLKRLSRKTGKPISRIIEEKINKEK